MADDQYIPASPKNVAIRPLNKGVVNNLSPGMVPKGGFLKINNFRVEEEGLELRSPWQDAGVDDFVQFPPLSGIQEFWDTSGSKRTLLHDRKFFYEIQRGDSTASFTGLRHAVTAFVSTSGDTLSVDVTTGNNGNNYVVANNFYWDYDSGYKEGDVIYVSNLDDRKIIDRFLDADTDGNLDTAVVKTAFTTTTTGSEVKVEEGLYTGGQVDVNLGSSNATLGEVVYPDSVAVGGKMVIVDGSRKPKYFDGTTYEAFTSKEIYPVCVAYFRDRLFMGQMMGSDSNYYRQKIIWSEAGNFNEFPDANYIELPYQAGALWRLVSFSQTLVALFGDSVYIGRTTSSSSLPVHFEKVETGGVGLVGMRAVASWMDRVFFIGQNNVYMVSPEEVKPVGTKAVKKDLEKLSKGAKGVIMGYSDTLAGKVGFGIPDPKGESRNINILWELDVSTGSWTKLSPGGGAVGFIQEGAIATAVTFDAFEGSGKGIDTYGDRIDNFTSVEGEKRLYISDLDGNLGFMDYDNKGPEDYPGGSNSPRIDASFETGDIDLDSPDGKKLFNRVGIKLSKPLPSGDNLISFKIKVSSDRGKTYKTVGPLVIKEGEDEGKVNFRLVGSQIRLKAEVIKNTYGKFEISEITFRVKPRGREVRFD